MCCRCSLVVFLLVGCWVVFGSSGNEVFKVLCVSLWSLGLVLGGMDWVKSGGSGG